MNISDDEADDLPLSERFKNIKSVRGSIDSSSDEGEEDAEGSEDSEEGQDIKGSSDEDEDSEDDIPLGDRFGRNASGSKRKKGPKPGAVVVKRAKNDSSAEKKLLKDVEVHRPQLYQQKEVIEPLKPRIENLKWWEMDLSKDVKWTSLEHNGVMFPPEYEPHGIPILYDGKPVKLTPEQEEVATFYAVKLETDYVQNPKFRQNFFRDWKVLLGPNHVIKKLELCDFSDILDWHKREREKLKELRKDPEYKAKQKLEKERIQKLYGFALVDGVLQRVGNFRIEPPGLFLGRGDHPKIGTLKTRVKPEDIIINIGPNTKIPRCPIPGHDWGGVVHSNQVTWLAYWKENVNESFKYVYLHSSSHFKGISDFEKYEKARKLKLFIKKIRDGYMKDMESADPLVCQRATAIWIIDVLALRAGNEKDTEDEADTVGCCSLRVEHLKFEEPKSVIFDFLGKDSMRYFNKVKVIPPVYKNLKRFCAKKSPTDQIFDRLTTSTLNAYLKELMPGLTAKVFRTFNASVTLEKELRSGKKDIDVSKTVDEKILFYNDANREVAILCNHQRSVPKNHDSQMEKMSENISVLESKISELKVELAYATGKVKGTPPSGKIKDADRVKSQLEKAELRLKKLNVQRQLKSDNKTVALGTSKINYMDPRITVSWCKMKQVPIEKIFNKSILEKFPWAMEVPKSWRF